MSAGVRLRPGDVGHVVPAASGFECWAVMQDGTKLRVWGKDPRGVGAAAGWAAISEGLRFDTSKIKPKRRGTGDAYRWNIGKCEIVGNTIIPTHQERRSAEKPIQDPWDIEPGQTGGDGHEIVSQASMPSRDVLVDLLDSADDVFHDLEALGSRCARLAGELVDVIEAELVAA